MLFPEGTILFTSKDYNNTDKTEVVLAYFKTTQK